MRFGQDIEASKQLLLRRAKLDVAMNYAVKGLRDALAELKKELWKERATAYLPQLLGPAGAILGVTFSASTPVRDVVSQAIDRAETQVNYLDGPMRNLVLVNQRPIEDWLKAADVTNAFIQESSSTLKVSSPANLARAGIEKAMKSLEEGVAVAKQVAVLSIPLLIGAGILALWLLPKFLLPRITIQMPGRRLP